MGDKTERLRAFLERGEWDQLMIRDAILEARLPSSCKLTLSAIVSHHSAKHPAPSVGLRRLAHLASLKPDTVNAALERLQSLGLVSFEHRRGAVTKYDLNNTMATLLTVYPFGTVSVPKRGTATVSSNGTVAAEPETQLSQSRVPNCPNRGSEVSQSGIQKEPGRNQEKEPVCASTSDTPPLALEPPPSEPRPKKRSNTKRKPKASKPAVQTSDHKQVVDHYFRTFEAHRGEPPMFGGAEGKAVGRLLEKCNGDVGRACKAITDGFGSFRGDTLSILIIAKDPSAFIGAKPRKVYPSNQPRPVQRESVPIREDRATWAD